MPTAATNYDELQSVLVDISETLYAQRTAFTKALAPSPKLVGARRRQKGAIEEVLDLLGEFIEDVRESQDAFEGTALDPFTKKSPNGSTRSTSAKPSAQGTKNKTRASGSAPRSKGGGKKVVAPTQTQVEVPA